MSLFDRELVGAHGRTLSVRHDPREEDDAPYEHEHAKNGAHERERERTDDKKHAFFKDGVGDDHDDAVHCVAGLRYLVRDLAGETVGEVPNESDAV